MITDLPAPATLRCSLPNDTGGVAHAETTPVWPTISVLVPVRNEERHIERTLRMLLKQDYPVDRYEVIVADGQSEDQTAAIVRQLQKEFAHLQLVANPRRWSSAGRNAAYRVSRGELIVVVDGHCYLPDDQYLRRLAEAFMFSGAECLGRPQPLEVPHPTPFQQAVALARRCWLGHNPDSDIFSQTPRFVLPHNTAVAYRRLVFEKVGLFDESFDACEDVEFNTRIAAAGLRCYFTPALQVHYEPRRNFTALFYQLSRYGTGRARLAFKHPHALTLPAVAPSAALVCFAGLCLAAVVWSLAALIAGAGLLAYLVLLSLVALSIGRRQPWAVRCRIPLAFVAIHFGFAWGFLRETLRQFWQRGGQMIGQWLRWRGAELWPVRGLFRQMQQKS